jgi:hypothetical protein
VKLTAPFENGSATGDLDITQDLTLNAAGVGVTRLSFPPVQHARNCSGKENDPQAGDPGCVAANRLNLN